MTATLQQPLKMPDIAAASTAVDLGGLLARARTAELTRRTGVVRSLRGLAIEAQGPRSRVGELCAIVPPGQHVHEKLKEWLLSVMPGAPNSGEHHSAEAAAATGGAVLAEVVALQPGRVTLMPYGGMQGLAIGSTVVALGEHSDVEVGDGLLGRVIDGLGRPLDGLPRPRTTGTAPIRSAPSNPMRRPRIEKILETGVRGIDGLLTLGQGQRVGIFAGSGVGKSTLLGMIARHVTADVNVIALIGERGREVREFIEKQLGTEGLARSVVVVASADQPALARLRAAYAALAIAEHFRAQGRQVLLTMDSITRLAMARREIGLSAGEPPTARGYPPSVFAELPELCERCGTAPSGGAITALLTVLVEGDDLNEPVSDALRAILDGHIVLSRHLAHQGQYPAIDILKSASRLLPDLTNAQERETIHAAVRALALLERNRQMVELGAYENGSNPELDAALACQPELQAWLRQMDAGVPRKDAMQQLRRWHESLLAAGARPQRGAP
ncbi:FliI/YscN family ATPase [Variovorax sp. RB2P76]|uniref:FliI/YscN family ATPase n=1 Tax=Variovorax sp. RB2P76 TaxID=3443736 RepID=UPI003F4834A5